MLIQIRFREAIARGEVTLTFRRWKRPQVVAGNTYRTAAGRIVVDAVDVVDPRASPARRRNGPGSRPRAEVVAALRGEPDLPDVSHPLPRGGGPDPRAELAATADALDGRRRRARAAASTSRSRELARDRGRRRCLQTIARTARACAPPISPRASGARPQPFKLDVRKLKNLGLTLSLEVGYRLSPRGEAYLAATQAS